MTDRYVALLRGINVGGNNIIKMSDLKRCFEDLGFSEVATYIQSGNVLFDAKETSVAQLCARIETALSKEFNYQASVVLRSHKQLVKIVKAAPKGFGTQATLYRYDVIFLKEPLTAIKAMKSVITNPDVDQAHAGSGVLYFSRLISKASQSRLSKLITMPIYKSMTIRNWNTTTALLKLMEEL